MIGGTVGLPSGSPALGQVGSDQVRCVVYPAAWREADATRSGHAGWYFGLVSFCCWLLGAFGVNGPPLDG